MGPAGSGPGTRGDVPQACGFALRMCGPNLECEELAAVFQRHLREGWSLHFRDFLNTTCKHLVRAGPGRAAGLGSGTGQARWPTASPQMHHFPELLGRLVSTCQFYFKSGWEDVRAAAPMLTGERPAAPPARRARAEQEPSLPPPPTPRVPGAACGAHAGATGGPGAARRR